MFVRPTKRQIGISLFIAAALNQVLAPIASMREMVYTLVFETPRVHINSVDVDKEVNFPADFSVKDYLVVASGIVNKSSANCPGVNFLCRDYNRAIFDVYSKLVKQNGRADLSDKVRICTDMHRSDGHLWLEYKVNEDIAVYDFVEKKHLNNVGLRTFWGKKMPYPTAQYLLKPGGTIAVFLEE